MTLTEKRNEKRLAKLYGWLATASLLFWVLEWIVMIVVRNHTVGEWKINLIILLLIFLAPIFGSLVLWTVSGTHQSKLFIYRNQIKEYRVRTAFVKAMTFIESGDLNAALEIYNNFIPLKHPTRDYLYSVLIVLMSKSNDPDLVKRGTDRLISLKDFYSPARINF